MKNFLFCLLLGFSIGNLWAQDTPKPVPAAEEDEARWSDFLPLNKEMAGDDDLPLPFGIGVTILNQKQSMKTDSIDITTPDALLAFLTEPTLIDTDPPAGLTTLDIDADRVDTDVDVKLIKLDAWVLPFMNIYGIVGEIEGSNNVVDAYVRASPAGAVSNVLKDNFPATTYDGDLLGIGVVLAFARDRWFGSLDYSYTEADLSISTSEITTKTFSPRIGTTGNMGDVSGVIWIGGMHQDVDEKQAGSADFLGMPVSYNVMQHAEEEWNLLIGGSVNLSEEMDFAIEAGVGEREQFMGTLTYRF